MSNVLTYLITARRCEVEELQRLSRTCQMVLTVGQLIHCLQQERGLSNLSWANFFGEQYASEVDVPKLRENGFNVEPIGEGFLVTLTPSLLDVMDNFPLFSERRVALRKLFRPGLFRINEEPKPLPQ